MLNTEKKWYKFKGPKNLVASHLEITANRITDAVARQPVVMRLYEDEFVQTVTNQEMWDEITNAEFLAAKQEPM